MYDCHIHTHHMAFVFSLHHLPLVLSWLFICVILCQLCTSHYHQFLSSCLSPLSCQVLFVNTVGIFFSLYFVFIIRSASNFLRDGKGTAEWWTNVTSELGHILISVLTCEDSLDKMWAMDKGLKKTYRTAGEAPPELMYVDCGCYHVHGVSSGTALLWMDRQVYAGRARHLSRFPLIWCKRIITWSLPSLLQSLPTTRTAWHSWYRQYAQATQPCFPDW